jgi:hypothetical protein
MNHRGIISTRKKEIRKLIFTWKGLLKPKNFICPETMEEAKAFDWLSPRIRIKKRDWYFSEDARNKLGEFVNILYDIPEIGGLTSYNTLLQVTLKFISRGLYLNIKKQKPLDPPSDISYIIQRLLRIRKTYRFIHVIEGIDLQDTTRLTLGDVTVFSYTEEHLGTLLRYCQERNERDFFDVTVSPFVRNHFLGKTCIQCIAFADQQKAREMAYNKIRQVMNVLRFIVCLFAHEIISENRIKICLLNESYQTGEHVICMNESNHGVSLSHGVGRKTVTEMPMGSNRINDITEKCFYRELCYLLLKEEINELEGTILTSIYWIGEAQNDFDHDSAYMK